MLLESKTFLNNFFHSNRSSYSFKNSDCHKFSFIDDADLKLGPFDIFDVLFSFLAFVKL